MDRKTKVIVMTDQYTIFSTFIGYLQHVLSYSQKNIILNKCWSPKEGFVDFDDACYLKVGEDGFIERAQIVLAFESNNPDPPLLQIGDFKPDFEFCCIKTDKYLYFPKYPIFYELFPYNQLFLKSSANEYKPVGVWLSKPLGASLKEPVPLTNNYFIMNGACFPNRLN